MGWAEWCRTSGDLFCCCFRKAQMINSSCTGTTCLCIRTWILFCMLLLRIEEPLRCRPARNFVYCSVCLQDFMWTELSLLKLEMCLTSIDVCKRCSRQIFIWLSLFLSGELHRASLRKQRFPAQGSIEIHEDNEVRFFHKTSCADFQVDRWKYCRIMKL